MSLVDQLINTRTSLDLAKELASTAKENAALREQVARLETELFWLKAPVAPAGLFTAIDAQAARRAERGAAACQCAAARRAEDDVSTTPTQGEKS
jgi:cell division protein FtsB